MEVKVLDRKFRREVLRMEVFERKNSENALSPKNEYGKSKT
jgi:hypothetical protein